MLRWMTRSALAAAAVAVARSGRDDAGQVAFNTHCRNCHSVKPDDNRLGPSLHNIVGAKAGQAKGFASFSGGLTDDITWDEATSTSSLPIRSPLREHHHDAVCRHTRRRTAQTHHRLSENAEQRLLTP